jgi:predicted metal-dependent enzyme (double-stranded beta helix superfamily)
VLVVVLRPDTPLPVHNHGTWAVIGIYKGREHETWFRRVDDGSVPGRAQLEVDQTFVNEQGTASVVPEGHIHTVEAMDGHQAVSIHIYGTDIVTQQRSEFDPLTGTERVFRPPFEEADPADQDGSPNAAPAGVTDRSSQGRI